jgi:GAF domain-containing protein
MWRFVLKENIRRFAALLSHADSDEQRETLLQLLEEAELELGKIEDASTPEIARRDASLKAAADRAVDRAMAVSGAQFASLQIFDGNSDRLIILAQRNLRANFLHHLAQRRPGDGSACGRCLADKAPAIIGDVNCDAEFGPHREAAHEAGFEAVQSFPVRDRSGKLIAVLSAYFEAPHQFLEEDISQTMSLADAIGNDLQRHLNR